MSFSSKKSNDKVGFEHFLLQKSPYCSQSIVTRTRLCCHITFQCDIARDWKAMFITWLRREGRVCWIIFSPLFLRCQKVSVQHFDTSIQSRGWLKVSINQSIISFSWHKTTFKRVIEPQWPLPGSTAGKICQKLVELSLTAGYPGTSQLLVISAGFSSKREHFTHVFWGEIGP